MTKAYIRYTTVKQGNDRKADLIENVRVRLEDEQPIPLEWVAEYNKLVKGGSTHDKRTDTGRTM